MSAEAIIKADVLGEFVDNALALVHEAKIHLNEDGFELRAVDPANVGMIHESLSSRAFESYGFDGGLIGVNLNRLNDILGVTGGELIHLRLDDGTRKLEIESGGMEFTVALIDPDSLRQEPDIPPVEDDLTATIVIETRELQRAAKAADLVDDQIAFGASVEDGVVYAEAEGDTDDVRLEWSGDETLDGTKLEDDAFSRFSLDYLKDMLKPIDAGAEATMQVGEGYPMFLESEYADGDGDLKFMLAPKVSTIGGAR